MHILERYTNSIYVWNFSFSSKNDGFYKSLQMFAYAVHQHGRFQTAGVCGKGWFQTSGICANATNNNQFLSSQTSGVSRKHKNAAIRNTCSFSYGVAIGMTRVPTHLTGGWEEEEKEEEE